ncbi:hypothetical protein LTR36_008557 [Oleoguttula mirabilis]|uniref:Uncharacterized protein n=1 Tax=Oleoguttula mirabilis TaxID=1507867 RepID=A0AAV9JTE3_9PEZI|nr:hypothetical protein LTR36_008557 [Oleoguttula mirabilis]
MVGREMPPTPLASSSEAPLSSSPSPPPQPSNVIAPRAVAFNPNSVWRLAPTSVVAPPAIVSATDSLQTGRSLASRPTRPATDSLRTGRRPSSFVPTSTNVSVESGSSFAPTFLTIPGELRNRIYRYAFMSDEPIRVFSAGNWKQPVLLATCKQIRHEAGKMFYFGSKFILVLAQIDAIALVAFAKHADPYLRHNGGIMQIAMQIGGASGPDSLVHWLGGDFLRGSFPAVHSPWKGRMTFAAQALLILYQLFGMQTRGHLDGMLWTDSTAFKRFMRLGGSGMSTNADIAIEEDWYAVHGVGHRYSLPALWRADSGASGRHVLVSFNGIRTVHETRW